MKALVSRSMKKKFKRAFPDWENDKVNNSIWPTCGSPYECSAHFFYWLVSDCFNDEHKRFFQENNIRVEG